MIENLIRGVGIALALTPLAWSQSLTTGFRPTSAPAVSDDGQPSVASPQVGGADNPGSLTTHFSGGNGFAGNMFDIAPNVDIEFTSIDIHSDFVGSADTVEVWFIPGTSFGNENSAVGWTSMGQYMGVGAGPGVGTNIDMTGNGYTFLAGQTYGIYVDLVSYQAGVSRISYTNGGPTMYMNADLTLTTNVGKGSGGHTASTFTFREWNGTINYDCLGGGTTIYCTAKLNSLGCTPAISGSGVPSASATSGYTVDCAMVRNNKSGLLFYKVNGAQASLSFQCGTLCVGPSGIKRTPAQSAGGNPPPANDCSGLFSLDMNAFAAGMAGGNPDPALQTAGNLVQCQWWGRDQGFASPCNTTLSDGAEYTIQP